eukprot:1806502-Prymnesium_polylepis.2
MRLGRAADEAWAGAAVKAGRLATRCGPRSKASRRRALHGRCCRQRRGIEGDMWPMADVVAKGGIGRLR